MPQTVLVSSVRVSNVTIIVWLVDQHDVVSCCIIYAAAGCSCFCLQSAEWQNSELNIIDAAVFTLLWLPIDFPSDTYRVIAFYAWARECVFQTKDTTELFPDYLISGSVWISNSHASGSSACLAQNASKCPYKCFNSSLWP